MSGPAETPRAAAAADLLPGIRLPVPKPPARISPFRWALWWFEVGLALLVFYGVFSIGWIGLRLIAKLADLRRRGRSG